MLIEQLNKHRQTVRDWVDEFVVSDSDEVDTQASV
jgi:hypothetical protein